jgi:uncharacterized protein (TIGR03790 family)
MRGRHRIGRQVGARPARKFRLRPLNSIVASGWRNVTVSFAAIALMLTGQARALLPAQVLVVYNSASDASIALAAYYSAARGIPAGNRMALTWQAADNADTCTQAQAATFDTAIRAKAVALKADVIVLCRNLPLKITYKGSLDSLIASDGKGARMNPYAASAVPFTHAKTGAYIVCRLDGWTWADANALVDRSTAAHPTGPVLLDCDPAQTGGFVRYNNILKAAYSSLAASAIPVRIDDTTTFVGGQALGGYSSWGSNDKHYKASVYQAITFAPGALACGAVSTAAAHLRYPVTGGQSQIGQLIAQGVTGAAGDVSEPFLSCLANPSVLYPRYAAGLSLGEAMMSATTTLAWTQVIVGDPLCRRGE